MFKPPGFLGQTHRSRVPRVGLRLRRVPLALREWRRWIGAMSDRIEAADMKDLGADDRQDPIALPSLLEAHTAEDLGRRLADLLSSGMPMIIDGQLVDRVATQCLQVLVAAARSARSRQVPFRLQSPSAALTDALVQLDLHQEFAL
jgi:anti-anti-sigma regulatory factor